MNNQYLESFFLLQNKVKQNRVTLNPMYIYMELLDWGKQLKLSNSKIANDLYSLYLLYFEKLDVKKYIFDPLWYDFNELIDFGFLKFTPKNLERAAVVVRDVLWEIIAFKTNRDCKVLQVDNLRALTNKDKEQIIFCCDICGYTEDVSGKKIKIDEIFYPATKRQILENGILPAQA